MHLPLVFRQVDSKRITCKTNQMPKKFRAFGAMVNNKQENRATKFVLNEAFFFDRIIKYCFLGSKKSFLQKTIEEKPFEKTFFKNYC